jgi:hypothetical protein
VTIGVVTADLLAINPRLDLVLRAPEFGGLTAQQVSAFLPSSFALGGRTVSVQLTPFAPKDGFTAPDEPIAGICAAQANSAIVITDVAKRDLVDCLLDNGSLVIDASTTAWDTAALAERAPMLWAPATAAADVAERVLIAEAGRRDLLRTGSALVVTGADEIDRRVAEQATIPALQASGLAVTSLNGFPENSYGTNYGLAVEELLATPPSVVRPLSVLDYFVFTGFVTEPLSGTTAPPLPTFLVTSNNGLTSSPPNRSVIRATQGLGWTPLRDRLAQADNAAPSTPEAAAACARDYPGINFSDTATNATSYLYRWCDAVNLLRLGTASPGAATSTAFRDAVWAAGAAWQPAAVFAEGWSSGSYAGANQARWIRDGLNCPVTIEACYEYEDVPISLK